MRVLYVGYYSLGSTSRMRGEYLQEILPIQDFVLVDIDQPMQATSRLWRTYGWRYKKGPLINNINQYLKKITDPIHHFDLIWIDKGVFLQPESIERLRLKTKHLIHYTPDPAFQYHTSPLFYKAVPIYDFCITTKSFEVKNYESLGARVITCTQGYDPKLHFPRNEFGEKKGISFIGHREDEREELITKLLEAGFSLVLAGPKWTKFSKKHKNNQNLSFLGEGVYGDKYAETLSRSLISLGLISKWIAEEHTTRTIEIPACKTVLATEKTTDTEAFFNNHEVIFFNDSSDLIQSIKYYQANLNELEPIGKQGYLAIKNGGFDYKSILEKIIFKCGLNHFKDNN